MGVELVFSMGKVLNTMDNEVDTSLLHVEKCVHTLTESFRRTQRQKNTHYYHIHTETQRQTDTHTNARTV